MGEGKKGEGRKEKEIIVLLSSYSFTMLGSFFLSK
jgi:hypothetical protein